MHLTFSGGKGDARFYGQNCRVVDVKDTTYNRCKPPSLPPVLFRACRYIGSGSDVKGKKVKEPEAEHERRTKRRACVWKRINCKQSTLRKTCPTDLVSYIFASEIKQVSMREGKKIFSCLFFCGSRSALRWLLCTDFQRRSSGAAGVKWPRPS